MLMPTLTNDCTVVKHVQIFFTFLFFLLFIFFSRSVKDYILNYCLWFNAIVINQQLSNNLYQNEANAVC